MSGNFVRKAALAPLLVGLVVGLVPIGALAGHDVPRKAHKLQVSLVSYYRECLQVDSDTQTSLGYPSCLNPFRYTACTLGGDGSGLVKAGVVGKPGNSDIKFSFKLKKAQNCEGATLCPYMEVAATGSDCDDGFGNFTEDCTTVRTPLRSTSECCVVTGGECKIKTTLLTALPGLFAGGERWSAHVLSVGLYHGGVPAFVGGMFLP